MTRIILRLVAIAGLLGFASAQSLDSSLDCVPTLLSPAPGSAVYYSSLDVIPFSFQATAPSTCSLILSATTGLYTDGSLVAACTPLLLDGTTQIISCPTALRGTLAPGSYTIQYNAGGTITTSPSFNITHTQATSTATGTSTTTSTPIQLLTITNLLTDIQSITLPQFTLTLPTPTIRVTATVTIGLQTSFLTTTRSVLGSTAYAFTFVQRTTAVTAPCTPLGGVSLDSAPKPTHAPAAALARRDVISSLGPSGIDGDGLLTVIVSEILSIVTQVAGIVTNTVTVPSLVTDLITVPNAVPTISINPIAITLSLVTTIHVGTAFITTTVTTFPSGVFTRSARFVHYFYTTVTPTCDNPAAALPASTGAGPTTVAAVVATGRAHRAS